MARRPNAEPIYAAADLFRRTCFTTGHSFLWPEYQSWTLKTLQALLDAILGHLDEGKRSFEDKLRDQLAELSDDAQRVAADAVGFLGLFPSNRGIGREKKLANVQEIASWRPEVAPTNLRALDGAFAAGGIGSPGAHYNFSKPYQLAFILKFAELALTEHANLNDVDICKRIAAHAMTDVPEATEGTHILMHLLFPDQFERIASAKQKQRIATVFADRTGGAEDIDAALSNIRASLANEFGRDAVDFYDPDIAPRWKLNAKTRGFGQNLAAILAGYLQARRSEPFSGESKMFQLFRNVATVLEKSEPVTDRPSLSVRASPGQGNWAAVPWIALLDSRETDTTQRGVYCVYLFREDMSGVYLTLNQGVTDPKKEGAESAERFLRSKASELRTQFPGLSEQGFALSDDIDLKTRGNLGEWYEISTVAHKFYPANSLPSDEDLMSDLDQVLEIYDQFVGAKDSGRRDTPSRVRDPGRKDLLAVVQEFSSALRDSQISFGARHDDTVRSFVASLATKRFAILTGLSGSGKTQLALRFGEWLGPQRSLVVPVRPDWTGAEALFGYEDALREAIGSRRAWHVPPPLEFMLHAAAEPDLPHALILDEMNLAHVERYFADVLSGMESDYPCLPNLKQDADGLWRVSPNSALRIPFPRNVFVVGTVNVDETTYMFSPKVLDRANTFEFRVDAGDLQSNRAKPTPLKPGSPDLVAGFLSIASDDSAHITQPHPGQDAIVQNLLSLHRILSETGFEFGHRVFYETMRFAAMYAAAGDTDPLHALDLQMMQKVLPRLHGSRRRLESTLVAVGMFCHGSTLAESDPADAASVFDPLLPSLGPARLPVAFAKVVRMTKTLRANQFVSFTE